MERLFYSKPMPTVLHLKPSFPPPLPYLLPLNFAAAAPKFAQFPPLTRGRLHSVSGRCLHSSCPSPSQIVSEFLDAHTHDSSQPVDSSDGSVSKPQNFPRMLEIVSNRPKVVTTSAVVLLSAAFLLFIHTLSVSPAFASFQTAAGGHLVRSQLLNSAWTGFLAGCLHTLSGPDHLAALAPLSIGRTQMESAAVGALWGCGHDAGQVLFGLLFLLLKDRLHIEVLQTWGTRVVGFTLVVIGAMGIREASEVGVPCVALENGECNVSLYKGLDTPATGKKNKVGFATFATGIVHGLQPDALMIVLPALALPSRLAGAAFLCMFLAGTVVAMGSYTVFIGSCSQALKDRVPRITEKLTWASSLVAIGLGLAILVGQCFGFSLY